MAQGTNLALLTSNYKKIFSSKGLIYLTSPYDMILDDIKYNGGDGEGLVFSQPVVVTAEAGATYYSGDDRAFDIGTPVGLITQEATVNGSYLIVPSELSIQQATRSNTSKKAYLNNAGIVINGNKDSHKFRLSCGLLYGQTGLGVTSATNGSPTATSTTITLTPASFATGIWSGREGMALQFYLVSNGNLISTAADSVFTLTGSNDGTTKTISVSGTATGITALVAATATPLDVYFSGARTGAATWNEFAGMKKIITNTGSLFGIDASVYGLWKSNVFNVAGGGSVTKATLDQALIQCISRGGLMNTDVVTYVNPVQWQQLATNLDALVKFDQGSVSVRKLGNQWIEYTSMNGKNTIKPYPLVKQGDIFIVEPRSWMRLGSSDITLENPVKKGEDMFFILETRAGVGFRSYSSQALLCTKPAVNVLIQGFSAT